MKKQILLLFGILCGINSYAQSTSAIKPVEFESYFQTGVVFDGDGAGPIGEVSMGGRFYELVYLGGFIGIHSHFVGIPKEAQEFFDKSVFTTCYLPMGANLKFYLTEKSQTRIVPYIETTLGGFVGIEDSKGWNGFFCQAGLGIDIGRFAFGVGYNGLVKNGTSNMGYIKIGIKY